MQQIYPVGSHSYAYELNKDFHFAAAHYIPHEDAGKCQQVHGHTYFANITIVGEYFANITIVGDELDHTGFLVNFKIIKDLIHKRFDHAALNNDQAFSDYVADHSFRAQKLWPALFMKLYNNI